MTRKLLPSPEVLIVLTSLWLMLTGDSAYWAVIAANSSASAEQPALYYLATGMATFGLTALLLLLVTVGSLTRLVLALLLITAALVGYFTADFGILFDENMLVNVIETNVAEASELISLPLVGRLVLFGILPALLVLRYPLQKRSFATASLHRGIAVLAAVGIAAGGFFLGGKDIVSIARNHREVRYLLSPLNELSAAYAYASDRLEKRYEFEHIAPDAAKITAAASNSHPRVIVMMVGETARAANFSLGNYARPTNPRLAQRDIVYFGQASSCGTATAESLPCMFALQGREDFDRERSAYQDNLLDIAARVGYQVLWLDNGNSCKKVCARVESRDLHLSTNANLCRQGECSDEILVDELRKVLAGVTQDTLVVLHQMGSHGPAYYLRHPERFTAFGPECRSADLGHCSQQEITNAYDNTILYTDYVIDQVIGTLETRAPTLDTALIYVSDHGESLGENHLYLHGMPYGLAPDTQTHVPMLAWFSAGFEQRGGLTGSCTRRLAEVPVSHDFLFHTLLDLLAIRTSIYQPELDLFAACRPKRHELNAKAGTTPAHATLLQTDAPMI